MFKKKKRNWQGPICQCGECLICILRSVNLTLLHLSSVYIPSFHWCLLHFSYYHTSCTKSTCACVNCFYSLPCKIKIVLLSYCLTVVEWCYRPVWSGIGIPKAETEGRSRRCSYATPQEVISSCRLSDKGRFAFISHCFKNDCKVSAFFHFVSVRGNPFSAPTFY